MREGDFVFDPDELTMVFTTDTKRHVRVAYSDGKVWYAVCDIAKLLSYRAPEKAANYREYGTRLLRVPHTSINVKGYTNCNCITKELLKRFLKLQSGDKEIRDWVLNVVIPKAERQFAAINAEETRPTEPSGEALRIPDAPASSAERTTALIDMIDQFIIAAVSLRRELQIR